MCIDDSMCEVVEKVKQGDDDGVRLIWDRYFPQVVRLAANRMSGQRRRAADEEDVAISVMESFFRAARAGRFPELHDGDGIWRLLSSMTCRKVIDFIRRNAVRPTIGESDLEPNGIQSLESDAPTPVMVTIVADQIEHLFRTLPVKYHAIALKKIECLTVPEIARECSVHVSTVERRLRIIREFWSKEFDFND